MTKTLWIMHGRSYIAEGQSRYMHGIHSMHYEQIPVTLHEGCAALLNVCENCSVRANLPTQLIFSNFSGGPYSTADKNLGLSTSRSLSPKNLSHRVGERFRYGRDISLLRVKKGGIFKPRTRFNRYFQRQEIYQMKGFCSISRRKVWMHEIKTFCTVKL